MGSEGDMRKVLYIGGFELPAGNAAAQRVISNAKLLRLMGFDVCFIGVSKDIRKAPIEVEGFSSAPVPYPQSILQWVHQICTFISCKEILAQKPDYVVLYNFPSIASLKILNACHKRGIKVIHDLTEWEINNRWTLSDIMRRIDINLRMRYCIKKMDGVIAISKYLYEYYKDDVKTILVPPMVDLAHPKWERYRKLSSNNPITLVYAGSPGGRMKDRLDVIVDEVRKHPNIRLNVVGLTAEQFFYCFGRQQEAMPNVVFKGRLPHLEAVKAVCNADFQMLIRNHNRKNDAGFPTKLVESMACGTPVIATVFSNITDYIIDGVNAFIVDDTQSIHNVFERVSCLKKEDIVAMKQNCLDMRDFDYHQYKKEFNKIFQ